MTRITGKLSFEHQAKRKRKGEKDLTEKFKIINLIHEKFNLFGLTGEVIPIPGTNHHRMPDITIPQRNIVIELDGEIHQGWDPITKLQHDKERDNDYKESGYKLIIINKELTQDYKEDLVLYTLENNGLIKQ